MSRVFLATETALDRPVVLKLLPPELASGVSTDRFRQEIRLAARLQHPHIVPLLSAGQAAGLLYYTMPFVEGESLRAQLARAGELPLREASRVLRDDQAQPVVVVYNFVAELEAKLGRGARERP